jgi:hypothetical protein
MIASAKFVTDNKFYLVGSVYSLMGCLMNTASVGILTTNDGGSSCFSLDSTIPVGNA